MKRRSLYIAVGFITLGVLGVFVVSQHLLGKSQLKHPKTECPYLDNARYGGFVDSISLIDCFGVISIEDQAYYSNFVRRPTYTIRDDKHKYTIVTVDNRQAYKVREGMLYVYDALFPQLVAADKTNPVNYGLTFYINGEIRKLYYPHISDVPKYIKIDITSGEVQLYVKFEDIPENDKDVFSQLS